MFAEKERTKENTKITSTTDKPMYNLITYQLNYICRLRRLLRYSKLARRYDMWRYLAYHINELHHLQVVGCKCFQNSKFVNCISL